MGSTPNRHKRTSDLDCWVLKGNTGCRNKVAFLTLKIFYQKNNGHISLIQYCFCIVSQNIGLWVIFSPSGQVDELVFYVILLHKKQCRMLLTAVH